MHGNNGSPATAQPPLHTPYGQQPNSNIITSTQSIITSTRESGFTLPDARKHPSIPASPWNNSPYLPKKGIRLCASVYENTSLGPTTRI